MRFAIRKKHKIMGLGTIAVGFVINNELKIGDKLIILPLFKHTEIKSIESFN